MEFLRSVFDQELTADINDFGEVIIESSIFSPSVILKEMDEATYEEAFIEWRERRKIKAIAKADDLLSLYDNKGRFNKLKEIYQQSGVIPFVGAGMSKASGYPMWTNFLRELRKETRVTEDELQALMEAGKYEQAAQLLADSMPANSFDEALENTFGFDHPELVGPIQLLPQVFNTCAITTNFDNVLKRCYEKAQKPFSDTLLGVDSRELPKRLGENAKVLVKIHGKANSKRGRVLTLSEYETHYVDIPSLQDVIASICSKTLLFMGCSLSVDRTIQGMAAHCASKGHDAVARHYAFVSLRKDEDRLTRKDALAAANIFPIWYPNEDDHDECIEALLHKLME